MNRYKSYWDRTCVSPHLHQALRDIGSRPSPRPCLPRRRWAALAACCALIFGLSWGGGLWESAVSWKTASQSGRESASASQNLPPNSGDAGAAEVLPGFLVQGPEEESTLSLPAVPYIHYPPVDDPLEGDVSLSRFYAEGSFTQALTKAQIQTIFWGAGGKPEGADGDLPWMLFWGGYTVSGSALYDKEGALLWATLYGEDAGQGTSFTLTLRPNELPFQDCIYSGPETTDVFGTPVTAWSQTEDLNGDQREAALCVSQFMAGEIGVCFEVQCTAGSDPLDTASWYNTLLVRQALSSDGGIYLDHLLTSETIPTWRRAEFSSLEEARQEAAFAPYLPREDFPGYEEFSGALSYQEGVEHRLSLFWHRGYDDVSLTISLPEHVTALPTVAVEHPEEYDVRLYSIPWCDSVPEEYQDTVDLPTFRASDMSLSVVEARGNEKDTGGLSFRFQVLRENGVLIAYSCDGLTAPQVWQLVQQTGL